MREWFQKRLTLIIDLYSRHEENQIIFPKQLILILQIQQCLQNLSYIYGKLDFSYLTLWTLFARPQLYLPQSEYPEYIILILCILYIMNVLQIIPYSKYIGIFGQLLRCGLINFLFEISIGDAQLICHVLIILISLTETLILQGTLNVETINFQQTQYTILDYVLLILNYCIMITYTYGQHSVFTILLAVIMTFFKIIQFTQIQPELTIFNKSLFLSIQVITLYLCIVKLVTLAEFSAEILFGPLIFKIIFEFNSQQFSQRYKMYLGICECEVKDILMFRKNIKNLRNLKIIRPDDTKNQIIYSSILMVNYPYVAYQSLQSIKCTELSKIQRFKKSTLIIQCLRKINNNLQQNFTEVSKMSMVAQTFLSTEASNQEIQAQIITLLQDKLKCLKYLSNGQTQQSYQFYEKYVDELLNMKNRLIMQYDQLPCQRTQGILGFFYADVMNDYVSANELFSIAALSDEKMKRITNNQDIFSQKMVYLIVSFDGSLKIERPSSESSAFLKVTNEDLQNHSISEFVPPGIREFHDQFAVEFLESGKSKYFRNIEKNYFYQKNSNQMIDMDFAVEINFVNELSFITFIQPGECSTMSIVLNQELRIVCLSQSLIQELNLDIQTYLGVKITGILPEFPKVIVQNHFVENALAYFDQSVIVSQSQGSQFSMALQTSYNIYHRTQKKVIIYYILQFEYFKKTVNLFNQTLYTVCTNDNIDERNFELHMNAESPVKKPYVDEIKKQNTLKFSTQLYCIKIKEDDYSEYQENQKQNEFTNILSRRSNDDQLLRFNDYPSNLSHFKEQKKQAKNNNPEQRELFLKHEDSSQVASLQAIRKSKYYKKYELLSRLNHLRSYTKNHKLNLAILVLCIIVSLIIQTIQFVTLNERLTSLAADIDLLEIKNLVYQPFESFLLTRWTLVDYLAMLNSNEITQQQYEKLIVFPKSNLDLGFDQLNENLKQVFDRISIQSFLENKLDIYIYTSAGEGDAYNISLRNSIVILLNYQYDLKMRYAIEGSIVTDSPYVYFSYKNYLVMKYQFSQLNQYVFDTSIASANNIDQSIQFITITTLCIFCVLFVLQFNYFLLIVKMVNKYNMLLWNCNVDLIVDEIGRLRYLEEKIANDQNFLFKFQFNLESRDEMFESQKNKLIQPTRRQNQKLQDFSLTYCEFYLTYLFIISLIVGNSLITYYECSLYLGKYPDTAKFFKTVSEISTDIPTMYSQRDILYSRDFIAPFFTKDDWDKVLQQITDALARTNNFIRMDIDFDKQLFYFIRYIISSNFKQYFESVQKGNLCNYIPSSLQDKSSAICSVVMNQNLQRGLTQILIYIVNYISTDMQINNFTNKTSQPYLELEGAFLVSNIINSINDRFHSDLIQQTVSYIIAINIQNIGILITLFLTIFLVYFYMRKKLIKKLHIAQRLPYVLPIKALLYDDSFERKLRSLTLN